MTKFDELVSLAELKGELFPCFSYALKFVPKSLQKFEVELGTYIGKEKMK